MKLRTLTRLSTLFAALPLAATAQVTVFNNDIRGYWNFDGDLTEDAIGGGTYDGTFTSNAGDLEYVNAGAGAGVEAKFGQAIRLEGSKWEHVTINGDENQFENPGGDLTVSIWASNNGFIANWQAMIAKGEGASWRIARRSNGQNLAFAGGGTEPTSSTNVTLNQLHHYLCTVDTTAGTANIYMDGVLVGSASGTPNLNNNTLPLKIGANPGVGTMTRSWNGVIDDVAVWSRVLNEPERFLLYNAGTGFTVADLRTDTDSDGMGDGWETFHGLTVGIDDSALDADTDGLTNLQEFQAATDPNVTDTDNDGLTDNVETDTGTWVSSSNTGTNPRIADTDGDDLLDGVETNTGSFLNASNTGTNPFLVDTDSDTFNDGIEVAGGSDPTNINDFPSILTGLIGYWPLDGDTLDKTANGTDGTFVSSGLPATPVFGAGKFGNSISLEFDNKEFIHLDGANNLDFAGPGAFAQAGESVTISTWIKLPAFATSWQAIVAQGEGSNWRIARAGNNNFLAFAGGTADSQGSITVNNDTYRHVVAISEKGANTRFYIDGVLDSTATNPSTGAPTLTTNGKNAMIGNNPDNTARSFDGLIDDVAIWNRALTNTEIATLYNGGTGTSVADAGTAAGASLPTLLTRQEQWRQTHFGITTDSGNAANTADPDSDGYDNLLEFAFGTDPTVNDATPFTDDGTNLTGNGIPKSNIDNGAATGNIDFTARFIRRTDYELSNLTYTVEFSHNLSTWEASSDTPTVAMTDGVAITSGGFQVVEVPYPYFLSNGRKARYFRVVVSQAP